MPGSSGGSVTLLSCGWLCFERETGIEPATSSLGSLHSTTELLPLGYHPINALLQRCQSPQRMYRVNGSNIHLRVMEINPSSKKADSEIVLPGAATPVIAVVVAIIVDDSGRLLVGQRLPHKTYPYKWEFPGGKVESGETLDEALRRELREELSIDVDDGETLYRETSTYSDGRTYEVTYVEIRRWNGEIRNLEFNDVRWIAPDRLLELDILEGNVRICKRLPDILNRRENEPADAPSSKRSLD